MDNGIPSTHPENISDFGIYANIKRNTGKLQGSPGNNGMEGDMEEERKSRKEENEKAPNESTAHSL